MPWGQEGARRLGQEGARRLGQKEARRPGAGGSGSRPGAGESAPVVRAEEARRLA